MNPTQAWPPPAWLDRAHLAQWRTWDCLFVPPAAGPPGTVERGIETLLPHYDRFGVERLCAYFHLGTGTLARKWEYGPEDEQEIERCLARWRDRLIGCAILNAAAADPCLAALDRWIAHGPMVGALFVSSAQGVPCTHPNFERILPRMTELGALVVQHTWYKNGGKGSVGESTPGELAEVARRHPETTFVCVHAGGEWEKGLRAIRDCGNVLIEVSGFDPTAGFLEMAVREIGVARILFGRERSFATELAKVLGATISDDERRQILGGNLRRVLAPIVRRKGWAAP